MTRGLVTLCIGVILCVPRVGVARRDAMATAREHNERAAALYDLGRFEEAARAYEEAFRATPDPALLFNLGQAYRFARDYEHAILAYRGYLRRMPRATNRAEVEARIAELQSMLEQQRRAAEIKPPPPQPPPPPPVVKVTRTPIVTAPPPKPVDPMPARRLLYAGIGTAGAGLALLGGGLAFTLSARDAQQTHETPGATYDEGLASRASAFTALQWPFYALGAAAVAAGGALMALSQRRAVTLTPSVGPGAAALQLDLRF
jgi:tetratricopeptide (TPR) repeat protein